MSDTPETDAAVKASNGQWSFVLKECCQRIERERDNLIDQRDCIKTIHESHLASSRVQTSILAEKHNEMLRLRDQWRECAERLVEAFRGVPYDPLTVGSFNAQNCKNALAEFRGLKETNHESQTNRNKNRSQSSKASIKTKNE